ncbi:hypothetical protein BD779DRAFT_1452176 [Infundibulicybe gibba]|nr:hypothetical protein BD779DRAFT_1452176 [Infundibulicybe gibba]
MHQVETKDPPPLEPMFYSLTQDEARFFKTQTGIQDDDELQLHILNLQAEAYKVYPYPCIRRFDFLRLKISRHPLYPTFLNLAKLREGALFLDIGCCFGNDIRKAIADGYPPNNIIASDLRREFWDLGHKLFRSTPQTLPVPFIAGDVLGHSNIVGAPPQDSYEDSSVMRCSLLNLKGQVTAIHVSALFHLFDEAAQLEAARFIASLLSPDPGSMIFGIHVGRPEKGLRLEAAGLGGLGSSMFCHSPESWRSLWDGEVFNRGTIHTEVGLEEMTRHDLVGPPGIKYYQLVWSVTRL